MSKFEDQVREAVEALRGLGVKRLEARVDGKVVTLAGEAESVDAKKRVMAEFNQRVDTENTLNMIRIAQPAEAPGGGATDFAATVPMEARTPVPPAAATPPAAAAATAAIGGEGAPQTHVVVRGDTLGAIAKKYYGKASAYPKIFEANRDILKDPDHITPGQELKIP